MPDGEEKPKSADRPTPKPPVSPATEPVWQWLRRIGLLSVALTVVLVLSSVALPVGTAMPLPTPAPSGVSPPGGSWISQGPTTTLSPGFFGADVRPYYALDP